MYNKPSTIYFSSNRQQFVNLECEPSFLCQVVYCFSCGKVGKLADLRICTQCEVQRAHAKVHNPVCVATVAAKAQHAHRVRLARDVRKKGKGNVEGSEEDALCVICMEPPEAPVKVRLRNLYVS